MNILDKNMERRKRRKRKKNKMLSMKFSKQQTLILG